MPLFASPRARQLFASPDMQIKDEQPQPRRRLFGGPARGIFRREDGDPGTIANYALFGLNGVESMREGRQRRDLFGMQVRQQKEDAANLDQAIGSLDPSMQAWARLNPEAAAESQFRSPPARYGDLERIDGRLGQRNEITGQYDWAPQVPIETRPPAGYRMTPDGNMEAVPGGPADIRQTAEGRARADQLDSSERQLQNALDVLNNDVRSFPNVAAGTVGGWSRGIPGTPAYDLNQALEPVRAILSFENLQEMRRNSTTGGALGSIAVRELELLGNTVRSLDTAQSPQQLAQNIRTVRGQLTRTVEAIRAARAEMGGAAPQAQDAPEQAPAQTTPRRMRWNPATGQLE